MSTIEGNTLLHTNDYHDCFNTESYLKDFYSGVNIDPNEAPFWNFYIGNTIRILKNAQTRLGSTNALEFGGGPCLWPSLLLAQYVRSIQFCDYTQKNLDSVKIWIDKDDKAFDWTNFFVEILDANGTQRDKLSEWEFRLRDALNLGGLSTCDVNDSNCQILSGKEEQYDIIFSSLCLEAACLTIEIFNETIERLVRLLKSGGLFLLLTIRNRSFYYVDKDKFFCLSLDETKVEHTLTQTNELIDVSVDSFDATVEYKKQNTISDMDGIMVIHAFKKMDTID